MAILHVRQFGEPVVAGFLPLGEGGHDELEAGFAIGIHEAIKLRFQNCCGRGDGTNGKIECHRCLVGFGEYEPGNLLLATPYTLEERHAGGRCNRGTKSREIRGLHGRGFGAIDAGSQNRFQLRRDFPT